MVFFFLPFFIFYFYLFIYNFFNFFITAIWNVFVFKYPSPYFMFFLPSFWWMQLITVGICGAFLEPGWTMMCEALNHNMGVM